MTHHVGTTEVLHVVRRACKAMSAHPNAPLTPEGRQRLCERIDAGRPLAHVADEGGVSRTALTKWYKRWLAHGEAGLLDRTSRPERQPTRTPDDIEEMVIQLRVAEKWGPDRIAGHLATVGDGSITIAPATVHRILMRHGISRLRDLDMPTGESKREPRRYEHPAPGEMLHVDVKKVGRIPDGGGWAIHGRGTDEARASRRVANHRPGYVYIHAAVDDHSRMAYAEVHPDERASTAAVLAQECAVLPRARRHDHQVLPDRQRSGIPLEGLQRLPDAHRDGAQVHPPTHPAHEWEGGEVQPDDEGRVALRPSLCQRRRAHRRARGLPQHVQPRAAPQRAGEQASGQSGADHDVPPCTAVGELRYAPG
jgi:Homeodomain-like domain